MLVPSAISTTVPNLIRLLVSLQQKREVGLHAQMKSAATRAARFFERHEKNATRRDTNAIAAIICVSLPPIKLRGFELRGFELITHAHPQPYKVLRTKERATRRANRSNLPPVYPGGPRGDVGGGVTGVVPAGLNRRLFASAAGSPSWHRYAPVQLLEAMVSRRASAVRVIWYLVSGTSTSGFRISESKCVPTSPPPRASAQVTSWRDVLLTGGLASSDVVGIELHAIALQEALELGRVLRRGGGCQRRGLSGAHTAKGPTAATSPLSVGAVETPAPRAPTENRCVEHAP
jgi:hypothetical protein